MTGEQPSQQRREFVRVDATVRVDVESEDGHKPFTTDTINLSGGGMLINADRFEIGTRFRFRLHLGAGDVVEGRARVVRPCQGERRGVLFEELAPPDRQRLIRFIFERQRAALAKTRVAAG